MRLRTLLSLLITLCLLPFAVAPATAEPEPDNWIWQAVGPVTSPTLTGTVVSNDVDWYMMYVASQTQMTITLGTTPCGSDVDVYLKDAFGTTIDYQEGSSRGPMSMTRTTPIGTTQFFIAVDGPCSTPYRVDISPATALLPGPPMPSSTTPTGEPNETADQAIGPLRADIVYTGVSETTNDADWFYFYANAAFSLLGTSQDRCYGDLTVYDKNRRAVASNELSPDRFTKLTYTPSAWELFYVEADNDCVGGSYRFAISPATAVQAGPPPPPPTPTVPAPMSGLSYRKSKKTVVVYWPGIPGAGGYYTRVIRGKRVSSWKSTGNTWVSYRKKNVPRKKGMRVEVQPFNATGPSASQTIKVRR